MNRYNFMSIAYQLTQSFFQHDYSGSWGIARVRKENGGVCNLTTLTPRFQVLQSW